VKGVMSADELAKQDEKKRVTSNGRSKLSAFRHRIGSLLRNPHLW
jgi:hypothetical protein